MNPTCAREGCEEICYWAGVGRKPKYCSKTCKDLDRGNKNPEYTSVCKACGIVFPRLLGRGGQKLYCGEGCARPIRKAKQVAATAAYRERKVREQGRQSVAGLSRDDLVIQADTALGPLLDTVKYAKDESRDYIEAASTIFDIVDSGRYDVLWPTGVQNLAEVRMVLGRTLTDVERADLVLVAEAEVGNLLALAEVSIESRAATLVQEALELAWTKYGALWDVRPTTVEDLDRVLMPMPSDPPPADEHGPAHGEHLSIGGPLEMWDGFIVDSQDVSSEGRESIPDQV